mgnify:CR=1 FL=1|tara:strand:- start:351 stop:632 length:282 start_codon:yes stop_codon:yes gene_type:complete
MYQEIAIIGLLTLLQTLFLIYLHKITMSVIHTSLLALKKEIADTINQLTGEGLAETQSVTPIQMFMMDLLKQNMANKNPDLNKLRNDDGTFGS